MKTQNISLIREDIISKLQSIDDYSVMERIMKLLTPSEKKNKVVKFPTMTDQQIIDRVALSNKQINQGKTISQEQLFRDSQNW